MGLGIQKCLNPAFDYLCIPVPTKALPDQNVCPEKDIHLQAVDLQVVDFLKVVEALRQIPEGRLWSISNYSLIDLQTKHAIKP